MTAGPFRKAVFVMRAVIQRVDSASVAVSGQTVATIGRGLLVFVGNEETDGEEDVEWLGRKLVQLRLFPDEDGTPNRSVKEIGGEILLVSQFTLFASTRKGTRPSWHRAARPEVALPLYESLLGRVGELLGHPIAAGRFGAMMTVSLTNNGPLTLIIDSRVRE